MVDKKNSDTEELDYQEFENEPSELDDNTHHEMRLLYEESARSMQFAKDHQWKSVGATLFMFGGLIAIAYMTSPDKKIGEYLSATSILITCASIFVLILYQFWQYNEISKINYISLNLSSLFREVRSLKSTREANVHRYIFLTFMVAVIILGAIVSNVAISKIMSQF